MKLSVRGADDGDQVLFEGKSDGDDPDIIIPPRLSIYLVYSAHLLLVTSIVAIVYAVVFHWELLYGVSGLCFCLYCTSVVHWYEPRFSSLARRADYAAVACTLALASYVATTLTLTYILIWYVGIACIGLVFAVNEYLYYYQVMRRISGASGGSGKGYLRETDSSPLCGIFRPTLPGTEERDFVYKRTTAVHLVCVHVLANALALAVIVGGELTRT